VVIVVMRDAGDGGWVVTASLGVVVVKGDGGC
jgi:hypothetical protein